MQQASLNRKIRFFQRKLFTEMSEKVLESFQTLCILELNRLIYLFRGIKVIFQNKDYTLNQQAYGDVYSKFISFLRGMTEVLYKQKKKSQYYKHKIHLGPH
jgi:hypothetical protein